MGSFVQTALGDKLGRVRFMQSLCVLVTLGSTVQTAAINLPMFLVGRAIAGIAVGGMVGTVPTYLAEISKPEHRGMLGGIAGVGISLGAMLANWVGFACYFAPYGPVQWRVPLAMQIPWGIIMFFGLATFMPDSPRHLIRAGKNDAACNAFRKTHRIPRSSDDLQGFDTLVAQVQMEMEHESITYAQAFRLYRRRALVSIVVQSMTSLTGINVIQYFQTSLYKGLGSSRTEVLALSGAYGTIAFLSNVIAVRFLMDRWGRRPMLLTGLVCVAGVEIYAAVMQRVFQHTGNRVGKGFAILGIYMFVTIYYALINSTTWLYGAEILPNAIRSKVMGVACASHFLINVALTQAGPTAFATIHENYYYVFVGCILTFWVVGYFYFVETRNRSLEDIALAFGDSKNTGTISSESPLPGESCLKDKSEVIKRECVA